jgi:hypothetical protein
MNKNIIDQYKISFQNSIFSHKGFPDEIDKRIITNNQILTEFIYDWGTSEDITRYLLPDIYNVLNNSVEDDTQSETVGVELTPSTTVLYGLYNGASPLNPDFVLPTRDFKEIVEAWRDFLLIPPLNGTKV